MMAKLPPTVTAVPHGFFSGFSYPLRALGLLMATPRLLVYILTPMLLNLAIGAALYAGTLYLGMRGLAMVLEALPPALDGLAPVLRVLLIICTLIVVGYLMLQFGVVLGSPWYDTLSEKIELRQTGQAPPAQPLTFTGIVYDIGRAILFEGKKFVLLVAISLPLLLINLLPGVGQIIATLGGVLLGALLVCLDFFDPALERRRLSFREKLRLVRRTLPDSAGFGLACLALVSIPLLNLLAVPICIAAGTLFFCDRIQRLQFTFCYNGGTPRLRPSTDARGPHDL